MTQEDIVILSQLLDQKFEPVYTRLDLLESDVRELKSGMSEIKQRVASVEQKVTELDQRVASVEQKVTELDQRVAGVEQKVTELDEKVTELDQKFTVLDEKVTETEKDYIMAFEMMSQSNNACVVIDIKPSAITDFMEEIDIGDGSIIGFVTPGGRELVVENVEEGKESVLPEEGNVFSGQEYYTAVMDEAVADAGTAEVDFQGEKYLFIYSHSADIGFTTCALVPMRVVTSQATEIRNMTIGLVILACVIVVIVGIFITAGIENNMRRISRKFGDVAKGDLTVTVSAKGHDEFQDLAGSATNMITNTKKLVNQVSNATGELEVSAQNVGQASELIHEYSQDITRAIGEINEGMEEQSRHAQECVEKTDILSNEIQEVSHVVERVEKLVGETEGMINKGMEIVQVLGDRAGETTQMTVKVSESIESLRKECEIINSFVATITEITAVPAMIIG